MDTYSTCPEVRKAIADYAMALGRSGEPAFVLPAIAAGFNDQQIRIMQSQLRLATGYQTHLCAVMNNGCFTPYWPSRTYTVGETDWVYNLVDRVFNPSWQSIWSDR